MRRRVRTAKYRAILLACIGFIVGFSIAMCIQTIQHLPFAISTAEFDKSGANYAFKLCHKELNKSNRNGAKLEENGTFINGAKDDYFYDMPKILSTSIYKHQKSPPKKGLIFVGIMTAQKYIDTRAITIYKTWAQTFPGQIVFFVGADTKSVYNELPIIQLKVN